MNNEYLNYEDYLRGNLNKLKKSELEDQLQNQDQLKNFQLYNEVRRQMIKKINNEKEIALKTTLQNNNNKYFLATEQKAVRRITQNLLKFAAILGLLIVSMIGLNIVQSSNQSDLVLAEKYFYKQNTRTGQNLNNVAQIYTKANIAFEQKNYQVAIDQFQQIVASESIYAEYAEWNLLMSYMALGQDDKGLFDKILNDKNHIMHAKALALQKDKIGFLGRLGFE